MSGQKKQDLKELATQLIAARSAKGLAPAQVAELMGVTSKYYAALERGTKQPSEMFLRFFSGLFDLEIDQMLRLAGIDRKKTDSYSKAYKAAGSLIIGLSFASPMFPLAASGLMAGVGAATILTRLTQAFDAKNDKDLAESHLGIAPCTVSNWRARETVPEKYVRKAAEVTGKPIEWFYTTDINTDMTLLVDLVTTFETMLLETGKTISPQKKGEVISLLYLRTIKSGSVDTDEIDLVVKAVT